MHKGYAFVQFANPFDARSACLGEDGRTISGQVIGRLLNLGSERITFYPMPFISDVNMVSEPKPHLGKLKEQKNKNE